MTQRKYSANRRQSQNGFAVLSALLALVIVAMISIGTIEGKKNEIQINSGRLQGDLLSLIKDASNNYTMENYPALQSNLPVSQNGVTLTLAESIKPSIGNLVSLGYLPAGTETSAILGFGNYQVNLVRVPAGCITTACDVTGMVFLDKAIHKPGTTDMNGLAIGAALDRLGGDALVSLNIDPGNMRTRNGATFPNPLPSSPAGVIGARVGFGASGFGRFLILMDPRDPNFMGNLTVAGNIKGKTVGVGTGTTGCRLGEIDIDGSFITRSTDCVIKGGIGYNSGKSIAYADKLQNNAASAGIDELGGLWGKVATVDDLTLNAFNNLGAACTKQNAMSWGKAGSAVILMKCDGGIWINAGGAKLGTVGASCSPEGSSGMTSNNEALICQSGTWMLLKDRVGKFVVIDAYSASDGSTIPKPSCGSGGAAKIYEIPQSISQVASQVASAVSNFRATDLGASWRVDIRGGENQAIQDIAIAQVGCFYN